MANIARIIEPSSKSFTRSEGEVSSVCFGADGSYVAAAGERGTVYTWDAFTGEQSNYIKAHLRAATYAVAAYPKAPIVAHCSEIGVKFTLVGGHGRTPAFDAKHMATVMTLDFSADGDQMASGDRGGETMVWNLWTGEPRRRFPLPGTTVLCVRFHPDGNRLAIATKDGKVRLYDVNEGKLIREVSAHDGGCFSVAFSADGELLASGGKDKKIKLWNVASGAEEGVLDGHGEMVNSLAFDRRAGSPFLLSSSDDKTVRLWNVASKEGVQTISHESGVNSVGWSPDGTKIVTGAGNKVQIFEVAAGS